MMELPDYSYVFVSGVTNARQQAGQRRQVNILTEASRREVRHVTVPYGLRWAGLEVREKEEPSQRTRGFLFLTLGATVAITAGAKDLFVYENGIGAINLPVIKFSVDWWNTLHQPASVLRRGGPSIHLSLLAPLGVMAAAFTCFFIAVWFVRIRAAILVRKIAVLGQIEGAQMDEIIEQRGVAAVPAR